MLGPYDQHQMFYDRKQRSQVFEWDYPRASSLGAPLTLERERHERFLQEAQVERRFRSLGLDTPWSGRLSVNVGSWLVKAGCRLSSSVGAWLRRAGCRLEEYGFGQLRSRNANVAVAADCGCS
jgi:hypothetical protein